MDRGDGIIRWSPNSARNEFLTINVNFRIIKLFKAVGHAVPERFDFQHISKHSDFQSVTAFDWSSRVAGLVALGTKDGQVQLLRIDDNSNDCITLPLKLQRTCHAVAFNTTGLLAVGLDRVRNDQSLQVWDINQTLSKWDPSKKGWQSIGAFSQDPLYKLEPSSVITSVKFFEDQPQTLVSGVKNQSVRIHDLRGLISFPWLTGRLLIRFIDPVGSVVAYRTRCNNNLAINHADTNYFASSALDQPAVMIWDRRASSRQFASKMYLDRVDAGEIPFGCALKISRAIDPRNSSYIRSIRYCRDQPGLLAVLSSSGELQAFSTQREYAGSLPENDVDGGPELLQVARSHPLQYPYFHENFPYSHNERIVSFDWINLRSSFFQPRIIARRSNQRQDIILKPATIQHFAFDLINFSGPVRSCAYLL
jgi:WD repeat-containing protein mio